MGILLLPARVHFIIACILFRYSPAV